MASISESTDEFLILGVVEIERRIAEEEAALKKKLADKVAQAERFRAELKARLIQRGADSTKTTAGTAYFSEHMNVKVIDRDALLAYAQAHWQNGGGALVVIRPPVEAVRDFMAMHGDQLPPGVETSTFPRLNVRGAT